MNNDLISREALKKALLELFNAVYIVTVDDVLKLIDNAPTVSFTISPDYVTELQNLNKELIKQLEETERPQGEWIDEGVDGWKCNKCGYGVVRYNNTNFCPRCGAEIEKGGAE